MPFKNRDEYLEYHRNYYKENKEQIQKHNKENYWKNPEKYRNQAKVTGINYRMKLREKRNIIFGTQCVICNGNSKRMVLHEIHGKNHSRHLSQILQHPEDFKLLCWRCHQIVHLFLDGSINSNKFLELVKVN